MYYSMILSRSYYKNSILVFFNILKKIVIWSKEMHLEVQFIKFNLNYK